ncbi:FtsX-like permease family protein [Clostridium sp. OS1-26]|uniref:FtsX-like permease family protein n=1 Tax=Clostridium sp. OS1-26 TaxID=3070681 RepID=UPI0027E0656D|nr:FtsX-like permease family protein [Clostridium sp. OS1-26]WML32952.1 hypothetical protein RCG18_16515 [Clostridium sp. OS1-26]
MDFKQILFKNIKSNLDHYAAYTFSLITSILCFFIQSILYNSQVVIGKNNFIVVPTISVFNTSLWYIYMYISFSKHREREFIRFLTLGMTCGELKILIFLENTLIFLVCIPTGLVLGLIFSKIIALSLFNFSGIHILTFQFKSVVYKIIAAHYAVLTTVFTLWSFKFIDNLSITNSSNHEYLSVANTKSSKLLKIILVFLIMCYFYLLEKFNLSSQARYYTDFAFLCILGTYILFLFVVKAFKTLIRRNKNFYYKKILLIKEIEAFFKDDKIVIFFIGFLNFMFIICERIRHLPNIKTTFDFFSTFQKDTFNLINVFSVLLSFFVFANILYFKSKIDLYNWKPRIIKLRKVGLTTEEVHNILLCKLKLTFFLPVILTALACVSYNYILNINNEFAMNTIKILLCYFIIQFLGYIITKNKILFFRS